VNASGGRVLENGRRFRRCPVASNVRGEVKPFGSPLPTQRRASTSATASALIALAIAIPISMLVRSLLTFLLLAALG